MPKELLSTRQDDATIRRWYKDAAAAGLPVSLMRSDGFLEHMGGWACDAIAPEMHGYRWQEYVDPEHIGAVLTWIADPDDSGPVTCRSICPTKDGPRMMWYGLSKVSGDKLRLVIGTGKPALKA